MASEDGTELLIGFICLFISCTSFGFQFAPLKRLDVKDGVFIQWVQCSVVFMAGLVINIVRGLPPFNLVAAIGGLLYATGNIASVPIVAEMGIGLGMLVWGSVQIIVGWSVAHFGLFGTQRQQVSSPLLNYLGVLLTLISGLAFVFVYSREPKEVEKEDKEKENRSRSPSPNVPLKTVDITTANQANTTLPYGSMGTGTHTVTTMEDGAMRSRRGFPWGPPLYLTKRKLFFIGLAVCLGTLHGMMLTPIVYVQDTDQNASKNVLDYVFSHFCAIFFFSTLNFIIYSLIMRGRPYVRPNLVLPAVAYGLLWTGGMTLWIVSNHLLSQTVSFPITVRLPAIIGALADVFLFKDIQERRQLTNLFVAIAIGCVGVALVAISLY